MGRRTKVKERKGPPPKGLSKYAEKQRRLLMRESEVKAHPVPREQPAVVAKPAPRRSLPKGSKLSFGKVSGNFLRNGGYLFLMDDQEVRIYLSDQVLIRFDADPKIVNGAVIECAVETDRHGRRRAVRIFDIQPPK